MRLEKLSLPLIAFAVTIIFLFAAAYGAAQTEKILYSFNDSANDGSDGIRPEGGVTFDSAGNLYGTTTFGGTGTCILDAEVPGCGTIFELIPGSGMWTEKILHNFQRNGQDGQEPSNTYLIFDAAGNLYGTTPVGGTSLDCPTNDAGTSGCGTLFELVHKSTGWGIVKILHSFDGTNKGIDGIYPAGTLLFDSAGRIYGTTENGGTSSIGPLGIAYRMSPAPVGEWIFHNFPHGSTDGKAPSGGLVADGSDNLYGVANGGGKYGSGAIYEFVFTGNTWVEKVIYSFGAEANDATNPSGTLVFDGHGNLYGVADGGAYNKGAVFELSAGTGGAWSEKVLHSFDGTDGTSLNGNLLRDSSGNLYGTAQFGGLAQCNGGCGLVFELSPQSGGVWTEKTVYSFVNNGADGIYPWSGLTADSSGNLYGVTQNGGTYGNGTVYEITP